MESLGAALGVLRYMARFARAVLRPHGFRLPARAAPYAMAYRLRPAHERQWNRLYARDPAAPRLPFSYAARATSALFFGALAGLGVNFRHLLYLRHELTVLPGHATHLASGAEYVVTGALDEVVALEGNRLAPVFGSLVTRADDGTPIVRVRDTFCVKDVPAPDLARLAASPLLRRDTAGAFAQLSRRQPALPAGPHRGAARLSYPANAGWRFGIVSGDLNLVHITPLVARLFGHPRPFAQGLFTANHVLTALSAGGREVAALAITFCRPVFLPQTATLVFDDTRHEVCDEGGAVLACGTHRFRR